MSLLVAEHMPLLVSEKPSSGGIRELLDLVAALMQPLEKLERCASFEQSRTRTEGLNPLLPPLCTALQQIEQALLEHGACKLTPEPGCAFDPMEHRQVEKFASSSRRPAPAPAGIVVVDVISAGYRHVQTGAVLRRALVLAQPPAPSEPSEGRGARGSRRPSCDEMELGGDEVAAVAADGSLVHELSRFDTLQGLALRYKLQPAVLMRHNRLTSAQALHGRKTILIPPPSYRAPSADEVALPPAAAPPASRATGGEGGDGRGAVPRRAPAVAQRDNPTAEAGAGAAVSAEAAARRDVEVAASTCGYARCFVAAAADAAVAPTPGVSMRRSGAEGRGADVNGRPCRNILDEQRGASRHANQRERPLAADVTDVTGVAARPLATDRPLPRLMGAEAALQEPDAHAILTGAALLVQLAGLLPPRFGDTGGAWHLIFWSALDGISLAQLLRKSAAVRAAAPVSLSLVARGSPLTTLATRHSPLTTRHSPLSPLATHLSRQARYEKVPLSLALCSSLSQIGPCLLLLRDSKRNVFGAFLSEVCR